MFSCEFYEDHLLLQNTSAGCFKMNEWIESWTTLWLNVQKAILTNKYEKKKEDPLSFSGNQRNKAITMAVLWLPALVFCDSLFLIRKSQESRFLRWLCS